MSGDRIAALLYAGLLLMLVIAAITARRLTARTLIRNGLAWIALFAVGITLAAAWSAWRQPRVEQPPAGEYRSDLT